MVYENKIQIKIIRQIKKKKKTLGKRKNKRKKLSKSFHAGK